MSRHELYSPEGLRTDGRRYNELRHFQCSLGTHAKAADGSALVEMGTSKVVCTVEGPKEPSSRSRVDTNKTTLTVNLMVSPFSSTERAKHTSNEKPLQELSNNLTETFQNAVITHFAPRTEVIVNVHVLAQDGEIMPSCVNAMCLALIDAGVPMLEYVAAVAVSVCEGVPLLDPNQLEVQALPTITAGTIGTSSKVSLLILEKRLMIDNLESAVNLAVEGCNLVREMMNEEVKRKLASLKR